MKKIKLIFISALMLILILGLNTTVLGAKSWNKAEFEEFIECMGYGEFDLDSMSYSFSWTKSDILNSLSNSSYGLIILKASNSSGDDYSDSKFTVLFPNESKSPQMSIYQNQYILYTDMYSKPNFVNPYVFDLETKTVSDLNSSSNFSYIPYSWKKTNNNVTEEEWNSSIYRTYLFEEACIFCDVAIINTSYVPKGGKITSSSYENVIYNGTITYTPSLKKVEWNLTKGFIEGQEYALFLNEWTTSNDFEYGLRDFNDGYIVFNNINTLTGSRTISNFNFETKANQVYQFCIGLKSGDSNEYIELIKTDWLIPNDNTLFLYPNFTRSHYFQLLNLVAYNPDTELPPDTGGDDNENPSGDTGNNNIDIAGGLNDFWGNKDNIKEEDFENQIKDEINNIMDTMSGELSQNQIFSELQSIENGFLNFFDKNQDERFYDLAFEWDNIELYNTTLIPEGKINISQMCRDIETLGYIQTLTRTLFCFGTCVLIIKQIYNLILSTLGIDNPYLYEDPNTEHISYAYDVNTQTGQMRETTFYRKGNRTYRYHK